MRFFRRHRRTIQIVLMVAALGSMTFGFLRRVGIDPIAALRGDAGSNASISEGDVR
jgi:hypothetical protein